MNSTVQKRCTFSENLHSEGWGETNNEQIRKKIRNDSVVLKIRWRGRDEDGDEWSGNFLEDVIF